MNKTFGERIKAKRLDAQLSQAALAKRIGVTRANISQIELGQRRVPLEKACALADVLNCSLEELVS